MSEKFWRELRRIRRQGRRGIYRITVDDVLSDDLIRFEFCLLNKGVTEFLYEIDVWGEGYEVLADGETFEQELGVPLSWGTLRGGQVFLYGEFEVVGDRTDPERFRYRSENEEFLRIDNLRSFRDQIRRTYSELLRR